MSNKEKVLAYFEEWAASKEIRNGFELQNHDGMWQLYYQGLRAWYEFTGHDSHFEIAVRILKLDPPQAAPIKWSNLYYDSETDLDFMLGDMYKVSQFLFNGSIYHRAQFMQDPWVQGYLGQHDSFSDGQKACQEHKQRLYNQLGGYNEQ